MGKSKMQSGYWLVHLKDGTVIGDHELSLLDYTDSLIFLKNCIGECIYALPIHNISHMKFVDITSDKTTMIDEFENLIKEVKPFSSKGDDNK